MLSPTAHQTLSFIEQRAKPYPPLKRLLFDHELNDAIAEEVSNQGHYDEEPVRVDISLDRFIDRYGTGFFGWAYLSFAREGGELYFVVKDGVSKTEESSLLLNEAITPSYELAFTGDGGIDLVVYTSPSKRIVVFATSVWDFYYHFGLKIISFLLR